MTAISDPFFHPPSGSQVPRFAGVPTFMRLPYVPPGDVCFNEVQIGLNGVPWDSGTTSRPGARHGPRQLRDASTMIRAQHEVLGMRPYEARACADLGDVGPPFDATGGTAVLGASIMFELLCIMTARA